MSNPSHKPIYSSRNKSQMAPNKKMFFHEKLGLRSKTWGKNPLFIAKVKFLKKVWKKEDQCTVIFPLADRPEVPYEVDFWRKSFPATNRFSENLLLGDFLWRWFGVFPKRFWWICKDFGLEPRRQMLLWGSIKLSVQSD